MEDRAKRNQAKAFERRQDLGSSVGMGQGMGS